MKPVILIDDDAYLQCTINAIAIIISTAESGYVMRETDQIICTLHGSGSSDALYMYVSRLVYVTNFAFFFCIECTVFQ